MNSLSWGKFYGHEKEKVVTEMGLQTNFTKLTVIFHSFPPYMYLPKFAAPESTFSFDLSLL